MKVWKALLPIMAVLPAGHIVSAGADIVYSIGSEASVSPPAVALRRQLPGVRP